MQGRYLKDKKQFMQTVLDYSNENKIDVALLCINEALEVGPDDQKLYMIRSALLMRAGKFKEALVDIDYLLKTLKSKNNELKKNKVFCLYELGEFKKAHSFLKKSTLKRDDSVETRCLKGIIFHKIGLIDEAKKAFHSVAIEPYDDKDLHVSSLYAQALIRLGEYKEAIAFLNAKNIKKTYYYLSVSRGDALWGIKNPDAREQYLQAIELNPHSADAFYGFGNVLLGENSEAALRHYEEALRLRPNDPDIQVAIKKAKAPKDLSDEKKEVPATSKSKYPKEMVEVDVPNDHNCLFWSFIMAYLLPTLNDKKEFEKSYTLLVGDAETYWLNDGTELVVNDMNTRDAVYNLLKSYDCAKNSKIYRNENLLNIRHVMRHRIVHEESKSFSNEHKQVIADDVSKENWDHYSHWMNQKNTWGGQAEIMGMSNMIQISIRVFSKGYDAEYKYEGSDKTLYLVYTNVSQGDKLGNHYHYLLDEKLYKKHCLNKTSPRFFQKEESEPDDDLLTLLQTMGHQF